MSTAPHQGREVPARAGRGLRLDRWDLGFLLAVLVILIGSIVPLTSFRQNLWNTPGVFYLGVGVAMPLVAAGLVLARGASRGEGPRAGSLSTAQFAHVASWLALAYFFTSFATTLNPVLLIGLLGAIGMVLASPLRRLTARALASSAQRRSRSAGVGKTVGRTGSTAVGTPSADRGPTPAAQPGATARGPVVITPGVSATAPDETVTVPEQEPQRSPLLNADTDTDLDPDLEMNAGTDVEADVEAEADEAPVRARLRPVPAEEREEIEEPAEPAETRQAEPEPAGYEAFWFAVGSPRTAMDPEDGGPAFGLEPGSWILALEDRGDEFLVQNTDGHTGVLRDLSDIERA